MLDWSIGILIQEFQSIRFTFILRYFPGPLSENEVAFRMVVSHGGLQTLHQVNGIGIHIGDQVFELSLELGVREVRSEVALSKARFKEPVEAQLPGETLIIQIEVIGMNQIMHGEAQ